MYRYCMITADQVCKLRRYCNEYQKDFAKRFGVTRRTIIRWEESGVEFKWWGKAADAWRKLLKDHPSVFTKSQREVIAE